MKSLQRLLLLGTLTFTLTGCTPLNCDFAGVDDVEIKNESNCARDVGLNTQSPKTLAPGAQRFIAVSDSGAQIRIESGNCPGASTKVIEVFPGDTITLNQNGSISRNLSVVP